MLLALFLTPLILIIPAAATTPALVIVGVFMLQAVVEIDMADFKTAVPAAPVIIGIPLTFSIAEGYRLRPHLRRLPRHLHRQTQGLHRRRLRRRRHLPVLGVLQNLPLRRRPLSLALGTVGGARLNDRPAMSTLSRCPSARPALIFLSWPLPLRPLIF